MTGDSSTAALPGWLMLGQLSAFDAYAQAVGTVMLVIALLQLICSFYTDARALRIFSLVYLATGIGWLVAHPRAHGGADDVPLLPVLVAVLLLAMNVWGLYEFLGLARQRARALVLATLVAAGVLTLWLQFVSRSALLVYVAIALAFGYCAWLALRAARREGNVGHLYIAAAFATYPLLLGLYLALPASMAGFEMAYYAAVPSLIVGLMLLAVSLIRARQRVESELDRRILAEESLRRLNTTLEERVAARTGELRELVAGLESFNRNVSHDLRDPLAGLSGLARLALDALAAGDGVRAQSYLNLIARQSLQMTDMVQDLLQLSRAADVPPQRRRVALRGCVDAALEQLRLSPTLAGTLQQARLHIAPLPEAEVDPELVRQLFVNLIGNALKFGRARHAAPTVTIGSCDDGAALFVEDDGLGLPPGREDELFQPFVRLHGHGIPGSGVGLTIVRRIVEAHGGRIRAERAAAGGARFVFTLPSLR